MAPPVAFFDLDNTLLRGTSLIHLGRGLYDRGYVSARTLVRAAAMEARYRATGTEDVTDAQVAQKAALAAIRGRDTAEFAQHCADIFAERIAGRFCPEAVALASGHLDAGHEVWLVTASPVEIAELCAAHLGFTGGLGTVAERADGRYTGRLVDGMLHGPAKATAIKRLTAENGYDLTRAYAYSDSANDLPMLSMVANPRAVNPDARLKRYAREHDWPVLEFREDRGMRGKVSRGVRAGASLGMAARGLARRYAGAIVPDDARPKPKPDAG
ncbi:MAG: HAD-IB family hydrolase, partial [Propionibacteriaceae bacterium]|nr:HAD-IB family hydrolase [Propionibacteriaceae bacterium]